MFISYHQVVLNNNFNLNMIAMLFLHFHFFFFSFSCRQMQTGLRSSQHFVASLFVF